MLGKVEVSGVSRVHKAEYPNVVLARNGTKRRDSSREASSTSRPSSPSLAKD